MKKLSIFAAMMVVMAGVALAATLNVPFFLDTSTDNSTKIAGFIGVKETAGVDQTLTVVYTALNASGDPVDQTVTFALGANQSVSWTPVQTNPAEGTGAIVPNMTIGPNAGSAQVITASTISGRYQQISFARSSDMVHVLLPQ